MCDDPDKPATCRLQCTNKRKPKIKTSRCVCKDSGWTEKVQISFENLEYRENAFSSSLLKEDS